MMSKKMTKLAVATTLAVLAPTITMTTAAKAETLVGYNMPQAWADWETMIKTINKKLDIQIPHDNRNSGQALSQLLADKNAPVANIVYYGVTTGIKAAKEGVAAPYKPKGFDEIPDGIKDPDGKWFAIQQGALGFFVNVDALGGAPVPKCFADLLKPEYKGMVAYLDPTSAFVGYAGAVAANKAMGGSLDNFDPGIEYFKKLMKNKPMVPTLSAYSRVISGEVPILFDYDFNAYRGKYTEEGNYEFVLPCEGTIVVPYVMSLVTGAPNPDAAKRVLDYVLSDEGQAIWANAYLKPSRPVKLPKAIADKFLPDSEYKRAVPVNYAKMEMVQNGFVERYLAEVK